MAATEPAQAARTVLYLSYDGLTDPLGRSQILPYLVGLAALGHRISIVSFEKNRRDSEGWRDVAKICADNGIAWHPERYHRHPAVLSTVWDILAMKRAAYRLHRTKCFDLVHCRSYIAAMAGLSMKRRFGIGFLFDMRGFYVDERIEMGLWPPTNPLFRAVIRYFRERETDFFQEADAIVSLTEAAVSELEHRSDALVTVIPCCVDFDQFAMPTREARAEARHALATGAATPVLGYLGSVGSNYLLDEMFKLFVAYRARRKGAKFLFLTPDPAHHIQEVASRNGLSPDETIVRSVARADVARLMAAADAGVSFIRPGRSKVACCPTKLGEMMSLGIPMFVNRGIGDVDRLVREAEAGVIVEAFDEESLTRAVEALLQLQSPAERIRTEARRRFDLMDGLTAYDSIYRNLVT